MDDRRTFPPGRGSQLTADERAEIQALSLVDGHSNTEIAKITGRDRGTIAAILKAEDTQELDRQLSSESRAEVLRRMRRYSATAVANWTMASRVAGERGDHRPAKELLLHARAIDPVDDGASTGPKVQILIGMPGNPVGPDPREEFRRQGGVIAVNRSED